MVKEEGMVGVWKGSLVKLDGAGEKGGECVGNTWARL